MSSNVYFTGLRARSDDESKTEKVKKLFKKAGFTDLIEDNDLTGIKVHMGEEGNDSHISPIFVKEIVEKIKNFGGKPFVGDTNTLYSGERKNSVDHLNTAVNHGFCSSVIGAPVIIADGLKSQDIVEVDINKKRFDSVKIASDFVSADSIIAMSHFKGHEMAGFGGSIKNLAMGCSPAAGKKDQHAVVFESDDEKCIVCGECAANCPEDAIEIDETANISSEDCIGCGECLTVCPVDAIDTDWEAEIQPFTERMTEYAYGAIKGKEGKTGYINFLIDITPDCDCVPWSDAPIVPDIGILASKDPVAIDKASYDLVNQQRAFEDSYIDENMGPGEDKFKGMRDQTVGEVQLSYGEEIGLGTREYNLIDL